MEERSTAIVITNPLHSYLVRPRKMDPVKSRTPIGEFRYWLNLQVEGWGCELHFDRIANENGGLAFWVRGLSLSVDSPHFIPLQEVSFRG